MTRCLWQIKVTFLTILGVKEICSFRLVLEGKIDKEIPDSSRLEFLEKVLANSLALSDPEDSTSGLLNKEGKVDLLLLRTLLAIYQNRESQVSGKWSFCFISICKFGTFKNPFALITNLSEPSFRFKRFILLRYWMK